MPSQGAPPACLRIRSTLEYAPSSASSNVLASRSCWRREKGSRVGLPCNSPILTRRLSGARVFVGSSLGLWNRCFRSLSGRCQQSPHYISLELTPDSGCIGQSLHLFFGNLGDIPINVDCRYIDPCRRSAFQFSDTMGRWTRLPAGPTTVQPICG